MTPTKSTPSGSGRLRLGELLVKAGVITESQLQGALQEQKQWGGKLGDLLVRMNYLSEDIFVRALSKQLALPRAELNAVIPAAVLSLVPRALIEEHEILPISVVEDGKALAVATSDPLNFPILDQLRAMTGLRVVPHVASTAAVRAAMARAFSTGGQVDQPLVIVSNSEDEAVSYRVPSTARPDSRPRSEDSAPRMEPLSMPAPSRSEPKLVRREPTPLRSEPPPVRADSHAPGGNASRRPALDGTSGAPSRSPFPPPPPPPSHPPQSSQPPRHQPRADGLPVSQPRFGSHEGLPVAASKVSLSSPGTTSPEDTRRQAIALKALVELLVEKGVFSMDEYLARLKR